ncbi:MAG TPA: hypothetical protein EYO99_00320 [Candidatus Marinimicrobia bacterium]|nr:hypothetical protein [Candidatus Neomarinimicrobiota bacterium]
MKTHLKLVEARGDDITFTFGRFNPPTTGHEKLIDATKKIGGRNYRVYASHSQDSSKNPLDYETKIKYMKSMFRNHSRNIKSDEARTAIDVAVKLHDEGFKNLTMVVGSDRVRVFQKLLDDYNGKQARHGFYKFDKINVASAGARDPDAEGISGMSASKMRKAAQDNDYKSFQKGLPVGFRGGKKLFKELQQKMSVKSLREWMEIDEASLLTKAQEFGSKKIFKREYIAALTLYKLQRERGEKSGMALHRAASTHRHVSDKGLQVVINDLVKSGKWPKRLSA